MNVIDKYKEDLAKWEASAPKEPELKVGDFTVFVEVFDNSDRARVLFRKWAPYQGGGWQTAYEFRSIGQTLKCLSERDDILTPLQIDRLTKWLEGEDCA